ncbi:ABC transporter ATP-binding protein [Actinobacteria bacterium YIM 96077]|uniref:ABC transporter ATP-binding protein n=1 Tax=Phytoactinopolyspora halophila TaxID=1981511 RepID=A0A329QU90_9ACTN|nr:ABC transporter ATP-binding protein [Phytoactinopolyspora halophila]AYY13871.1 ABC transporter ATP-binding protein [Actinobacteria bacterium YIM 96077]RAW15586.1 ABC transporter ATP-binding protein [Phytoactinopolyspora halophila]
MGDEDGRLVVDGLNVYYDRVHVLQDVGFEVGAEPVAMVGRNGMGKTTLAKALLGLVPAASGSVRFGGQELLGASPYKIVKAGIGYVPQGRRIWPSLSTHEHLVMVGAKAGSRWTVDTVYDVFPRLAERRDVSGANLSGGEQQMLAIARALLTNPRLLVMDEPSEGLAPAIVEHLASTLRSLVDEGQSVFLVEQNLRFATELGDHILVMVNGRIATDLRSEELLADEEKQNLYLGVA